MSIDAAQPDTPDTAPLPVRGKSGPKRTLEQRESDLAVLTELMIRKPHVSHNEAAAAINATRPLGPHISREQAKHDKKTVRVRMAHTGKPLLDELRGLVTRQIFLVQSEALEAWKKSQTPKESTRSKTVERGGTVRGASGEMDLPAQIRESTAELITESRNGNPAFLDLFLRATEKLIKTYGLAEPEQQVVTHRVISDRLRQTAAELGLPIEVVEAEWQRIESADQKALASGKVPDEPVEGDFEELELGDGDETD